MIYKCDVCPAEFKTQRGLENHKHRWFCKKCGAKLRTEKGYERHMKNHEGDIVRNTAKARIKAEQQRIAAEQERERQLKFQEDIQKLKEMGLFTPKYKEGDRVILSTYRVTKPTHEWRRTRLVHVRYEEERQYYADTFTVKCVCEPESPYTITRCIANNGQYPVMYRTEIGCVMFEENDVFDNLEDAKKDALEAGKAYKEACDFASQCR